MTRWLLVLGLWGMLIGTAGAEDRGLHSTEMWVYPLGNGKAIDMSKSCHIGDAALTYQDKLINCYGEKGWRENQMMPTACELKMQAAMEAMEERVTKKEESEWTFVSDGTATIRLDHMQFYDNMPLAPLEEYKPDTRTAEERLEDEFKALEKRKAELAEQRVREAKDKIEREERQAKNIKADHLWAEAKTCWRKP